MFKYFSTNLKGFPEKIKIEIDVSSILGIIFFGFATSFLFPTFVCSLVFDKQNHTLGLMKIMGLSMDSYWIANIINFCFDYSIVTSLFGISGYFSNIRLFTQTSPFLLLLLSFIWGLCLSTGAFIASFLFQKIRTASILSYSLLVISVLSSNLLNATN